MTADFTISPYRKVAGQPPYQNVWPDQMTLSDHPTFLVFAAAPLADRGSHFALKDSALPAWVREEASTLTDKALSELGHRFQGIPIDKPLIMHAAGADSDAASNLFRFAGDALPGQMLTVLEGEPWQTPSPSGRNILQRALVHELIHLWQARIRPRSGAVPAWIHEGAAEAMAAEILATLGYWDGETVARFHRKAHDDCDRGLRNRRFDGINKADDFRTVYACGHRLALLAAGPSTTSPTPVLDFWQAFVRRSLAEEGTYSLESWLTFTARRSGNRNRTDAIRDFLRRKWSLPGARLDQISTIEPDPGPVGD